MFAVIETGGKQYRVAPGDKIRVEKIESDKDSGFVFDKVVLLSDDANKVKVGTPYVAGAKVQAKVLGEVRGKKVIVFKFKAKKRQRTKNGHRQPYTEVVIEKISG